MRQLFPRGRAASPSRAFSRRIQALEQCTRAPRSNAVARCDADRGGMASRALDRHAAPPGRRSPHRRASRLPGLGRASARRRNLFAVPHRLLRPDRGDLRAAQPWTRPARFQKPRRFRASDWRRTSPVSCSPASHPATLFRLDLPCSAQRWSGSTSWRWTAPGGCKSIRPAPFEGEEDEP